MKETLGHLPTEQINPATTELSRLPTLDALRLMNDEDARVAGAVRLVLPEVARAVDAVAERMARGGRLFYVGAGTSGRLGVIDAAECPPTFGTPPEWVQALIAGGPQAVFQAQEGAEDDAQAGARELAARGLNAADSVVGLAASGRTPYVMGALRGAREMGAFTAGVTVNPAAALRPLCDVFIAPVVGPEALAGSTRLKAGTAQKLVLNLLSTGVMLRLGRVEGNLMLNLRPSCEKLQDRALRLVMQGSGADEPKAQAALDASGGEVRAALSRLRGENGSG